MKNTVQNTLTSDLWLQDLEEIQETKILTQNPANVLRLLNAIDEIEALISQQEGHIIASKF